MFTLHLANPETSLTVELTCYLDEIGDSAGCKTTSFYLANPCLSEDKLESTPNQRPGHFRDYHSPIAKVMITVLQLKPSDLTRIIRLSLNWHWLYSDCKIFAKAFSNVFFPGYLLSTHYKLICRSDSPAFSSSGN